jgi:hypothetical protein
MIASMNPNRNMHQKFTGKPEVTKRACKTSAWLREYCNRSYGGRLRMGGTVTNILALDREP